MRGAAETQSGHTGLAPKCVWYPSSYIANAPRKNGTPHCGKHHSNHSPNNSSRRVTTKPTPDTVHSPTPGQLHVESIQLACTCALCCCYALCMKREELLIFYSFWLRCFVVMMQYVGFLGRSQLFGSQVKVGAPTWQLARANSRVGAPTAKLARQLGAPTLELARANSGFGARQVPHSSSSFAPFRHSLSLLGISRYHASKATQEGQGEDAPPRDGDPPRCGRACPGTVHPVCTRRLPVAHADRRAGECNGADEQCSGDALRASGRGGCSRVPSGHRGQCELQPPRPGVSGGRGSRHRPRACPPRGGHAGGAGGCGGEVCF